MKTDVLLVAATKRELEGLLTKMDGAARIAEQKVISLTTGVGKVQSSLSTLEALHTYEPSLVVVVGYAGALDPTLVIGDAIIAEEAVQYDLDLSSFGLKVGESFDADGKVSAGRISLFAPEIQGYKRSITGTADRFLVRSYRGQNPFLTEELCLGVSDMESFAIAQACRMKAVPCSVLRIISDDAAGHRPKDFKRFVRNAAEVLRDGLVQLLEAPREKSPTNL